MIASKDSEHKLKFESEIFGRFYNVFFFRHFKKVSFCKDFWDWKKLPIAERHVPRNNPRKNCGAHFGSSFLLVSKVAKEFIGHVTIVLQVVSSSEKEKCLQLKSLNYVKFRADVCPPIKISNSKLRFKNLWIIWYMLW